MSSMDIIVINSTLQPYEPAWVFDFERGFKLEEYLPWMRDNWRMTMVLSAVYVVLVFGGRWFMSFREPFDLRTPLALWSAGLAAFSSAGMIRTVAGTYDAIWSYGLHASVCDPVMYKGVTGYWLWVFAWSKVPELGDTAFIVLRKQNLMFLHWYHHITVLVYCWYTLPQVVALARYFAVMNYSIHTMMYSYYAIRASRLIRIPTWIGMVITSLQITQMVVGCVVNGYAYYVRRRGGECATNDANLFVSFLMYSSYLLLFVHFFCGRYMTKPISAVVVGGNGKMELNANVNPREKKGL